jgi:digeranylgeranylglycerophospholipid reductase
MTQLLYLASNERYDRLMRDLQSADIETLSGANEGGWRSLLQFVHASDLPLLARFARDRLEE